MSDSADLSADDSARKSVHKCALLHTLVALGDEATQKIPLHRSRAQWHPERALDDVLLHALLRATLDNAMKLGDLEFKASDFEGLCEKNGVGNGGMAAAIANELLEERLAKAQAVHGGTTRGLPRSWSISPCDEHSTHTARLVCIEELES